jgi:DNA polymerase-3 subunit beta
VNEYEMLSEPAKEFPEVPRPEDGPTVEISVGVLRKLVHRTAFAAAKESTKFAMTGVLWEPDGKNVRLVATDSKRLALAVGPVTKNNSESKGQSHLVPSKAMVLLERHLQELGEEDVVRVWLRPNEAQFQTDTTTIYTRLVEGRFPPYREIFPKKTSAKIALASGPFLTAVRQSAVMTDEESKRVAFHFGKGQLTLEAQGPTAGRAKVPLTIEYDGEPIDVNFDPSYLIDLQKVLAPEEALQLELVDGARPALFKCGGDYSYLVMPQT